MATENLRELEREVEAARAKLAGNLSTLRSPGTYSEFADNIKQTALDTKNSLVEDARSRTLSAVDEFVDRLKARAAANPAALLVIGAGVAWHLLRRPPIVTALVGGGLYSLLRTQPARSHLDDRQYMDEAKSRLKEQASDMARSAGDAGMQAADAARHKAAELAQSAAQAGRQATDIARQKAAELAESAVQAGRQATGMAKQKAGELADAASNAGQHAADAVRSTAAGWTGQRMSEGRAIGSSAPSAEELYEVPRLYPNGDYDDGRYEGGTASNSGLPMDKLLLGAAGVAVAAAVALAYHRRPDDYDRPMAD